MTRNRTLALAISATITVISVSVLVGLIGQSATLANTEARSTVSLTETRLTVTGTMTIHNGTDNDQPTEIVDWAVGRYELAGLVLPASEIHFHAFDGSLAECRGHGGYHQVINGEDGLEHLIDICAVGGGRRRRLMLHEFAHAWAQHHLDRSERSVFISHRGLEAWNDGNDLWEERATEHAAEIMVWGSTSAARPARCSSVRTMGRSPPPSRCSPEPSPCARSAESATAAPT